MGIQRTITAIVQLLLYSRENKITHVSTRFIGMSMQYIDQSLEFSTADQKEQEIRT